MTTISLLVDAGFGGDPRRVELVWPAPRGLRFDRELESDKSLIGQSLRVAGHQGTIVGVEVGPEGRTLTLWLEVPTTLGS